MDLNIDQLDSEERKKINALLRERNDVNKDKGVEYIFRQPDEREEFLLGKKIDLNKMVKDEKAMMGESEAEFQERMEKRKLMQKMREDPMAIIQLNEQQAHKVALEKQKVHQKLSKAHNSKFIRKTSVSSSDSDSSNCMDKLRELLEKRIDNDDDNPIGNILIKMNPKISNKNQNIKQLSTSPKTYNKRNGSNYYKQNRKRKRSSSYSCSSYQKNQTSEYSQRNLSKNEKLPKKSNFRENKQSKVEINSEKLSKYKRHKHSRSRSPYSRHKSINVNHRTEFKPKLSKEQREQRLQEMKDNAQELDLTIQDLDRKFQKQDKKETEELKKNLKNSEEYLFKEIVKLSSSSSLQSNLKERQKFHSFEKYSKC